VLAPRTSTYLLDLTFVVPPNWSFREASALLLLSVWFYDAEPDTKGELASILALTSRDTAFLKSDFDVVDSEILVIETSVFSI